VPTYNDTISDIIAIDIFIHHRGGRNKQKKTVYSAINKMDTGTRKRQAYKLTNKLDLEACEYAEKSGTVPKIF